MTAPPRAGLDLTTKEAVYLTTAIGGAVFFLGLFATGLDEAAPRGTGLALSILGGIGLFAGFLLGALSRHFPDGTRALFGVGAGLAALYVLFGATFWYAAPVYVCGALAAAPAMLALKAFVGLRGALVARWGEGAPTGSAGTRPQP